MSGAAELPDAVEAVEADAADVIGDGDLEGERPFRRHHLVSPHDELVVHVAMGSVELPRHRHEIEIRPASETLADCPVLPAIGAVAVAIRSTAMNVAVRPGEIATMPSTALHDGAAAYFISMVPSGTVTSAA